MCDNDKTEGDLLATLKERSYRQGITAVQFYRKVTSLRYDSQQGQDPHLRGLFQESGNTDFTSLV